MSGQAQQHGSCRVGAQHHARLQVKAAQKSAAASRLPPARCNVVRRKAGRHRMRQSPGAICSQNLPERWSDMP